MELFVKKLIISAFLGFLLFAVACNAQDSLNITPDDTVLTVAKPAPKVAESAPKVEKSNTIEQIKDTMPAVKWSLSFNKIFWALIILFIAFLIIKYVTRFLEAIAEKSDKMRLSIKRIIPIFRIFGWTFVLYIIIAGVFVPPIETLIAVTGAAGIAVGFASQDILKNIFGGIMILFDHPFQVGDKIQVGNSYGEVVNIGLRTVRIVTPDDSLVSVPNNEIVNQSVSNSNSGEFNCQVVAEFFLPMNIDIPKVKQVAFEAAVISKYVYLNKPVAVIIKNEIHEGQSILKMRLKAYVLDIRYEFPFMSEMTEIVVSELLARKLVDPQGIPYFAQQQYSQKTLIS